jgi:anti-sigma-K factor RskA
MRYRNKPALQDKLAAEYVLGTLRGRARLRFQAWMREDAALRRAVAEWEGRLAPMAAAVAEVRPPRRVWQALESRVMATAPRPANRGFWESLAFWRGWGLIASGCAAALVVALALQEPRLVEVPVEKIVEKPATGMQQSYVAILRAAENSEKLVFVAYAGRHSNELWVKKVALGAAPADKGYELWGLPAKEGEPPKSLGMLPAEEKGTMKLVAAADQSLKDFPALAISIEPPGGSSTGQPTGPVIASGPCLKFW